MSVEINWLGYWDEALKKAQDLDTIIVADFFLPG